MRRLRLASDWDCVKTIFDRVGVATTKLQARPQLLHESRTSQPPAPAQLSLFGGLIDNNVNTRITSL